jgi:hypothetical protein
MTQRHRTLFASTREGAQWWTELFETLLWPKLASAWTLAFRPARIGLGVILLILVALLAKTPTLWLEKGDSGPLYVYYTHAVAGAGKAVNGVIGLSLPLFIDGIAQAAAEAPIAAVKHDAWSTAAVALPLLALVAIFGGAISRMAATEFARGERISWTTALAFSLRRGVAFTSTLASPLLGALIIGGIIAVAGWALLSIGWVQVAGAVLYGLALLLILGAVLLLVGYVFGFPLLIPALACEGTDAIDAIQRTYAYVLGRPVRLIAYTLLSLAMMVALLAVVGGIGSAAISATAVATTTLTNDTVTEAVRSEVPGLTKPRPISVDSIILGTAPPAEPDFGKSLNTTKDIIGFWHNVVALLVAGIGVSYFFSSSTVLYLILREINDGQDHTELWTPGRSAGFGSRKGTVAEIAAPSGAGEDLA